MICQIKAAWTEEIPLEIDSGSAQRKVSDKPRLIMIQYWKRKQEVVSDWLSALVG